MVQPADGLASSKVWTMGSGVEVPVSGSASRSTPPISATRVEPLGVPGSRTPLPKVWRTGSGASSHDSAPMLLTLKNQLSLGVGPATSTRPLGIWNSVRVEAARRRVVGLPADAQQRHEVEVGRVALDLRVDVRLAALVEAVDHDRAPVCEQHLRRVPAAVVHVRLPGARSRSPGRRVKIVFRPSRRPTVPPMTSTVPSSRNDWPAQKMLAGSSSPPGIFGGYTALVVFVTGSSRNARPGGGAGEVEDLAGVQHHGVHGDAGNRELRRPLADLRRDRC